MKEWTSEEVSTWAKSINSLPVEVSVTLYENEITGKELLALSIEGLKMMGIERAGTLCLLLKEIEKLDKASKDIVTLIEHSPYCFGKILNQLRLMQLHSIGLIAKEPALPEVDESQKARFEKVVNYYFPGDAAKIMSLSSLTSPDQQLHSSGDTQIIDPTELPIGSSVVVQCEQGREWYASILLAREKGGVQGFHIHYRGTKKKRKALDEVWVPAARVLRICSP